MVENIENSEILFHDALKLYSFKARELVSLSVRISPLSVMTFYFEQNEFQQLLEKHTGPQGFETDKYFVLQKANFLRVTYKAGSLNHELRIPTSQWQTLINDYKEKMNTSNEDTITCTVS